MIKKHYKKTLNMVINDGKAGYYYQSDYIDIPAGKGGYGERIKIISTYPVIVKCLSQCIDYSPLEYWVNGGTMDKFPVDVPGNCRLYFSVVPFRDFDGECIVSFEVDWISGGSKH